MAISELDEEEAEPEKADYYKELNYKNNVYLKQFVIAKDKQGRGIGTKLIEYLKRYMLSNSCTNIYLYTSKSNIIAQNFYKKNGLEKIGEWTGIPVTMKEVRTYFLYEYERIIHKSERMF